MRIRKNRKLTASMIWSTAATPSTPNPPPELMQPHICVVNRSPWDAPPMSLPLLNYNYDDFLYCPVPSSQHQDPKQVMDEEDNHNPIEKGFTSGNFIPIEDSHRSIDSMNISPNFEKNLLQDQPPTSSTLKNSKHSAPGPSRPRGRPRKVLEPSSLPLSTTYAKSNDFVYYSGFGPSWGKRRRNNDLKDPFINEDDNNLADKSKNNTSSSSLEIKGTKDEMDYINADDDELESSVPRRARKPIKAKSLKSLILG